jgi:hypothetical protein
MNKPFKSYNMNQLILFSKSKRYLFLITLFFVLSGNINAQYNVVLRPGINDGKNALIVSNLPNTNYAKHPDFAAIAWTSNNDLVDARSFIQFDLSGIPEGATINSAKLSLYSYNSPSNGSHSSMNGSNESYLRRITEPWIEDSITWNNQPAFSEINQVLLPQSTGSLQNYTDIDVTKLVMDMLGNDKGNFGFVLQLANESYYRRMVFASSANSNINIRPKLEIDFFMENESFRKISATQGGFTGELKDNDQFANGVAIGDIDGDGIEDLAVGAQLDDDGFANAGAVWILFMNEDRSVKGHKKISNVSGWPGSPIKGGRFGNSIAAIGDFDNDGVPDIVVGSYYDDDGGVQSGAVYIMMLNRDGSVKSHQKISATQGGLNGLIANRFFGSGVSSLGDLDGDGIIDIAVGAPNYDDDGGFYKGSVWILFLNQDGTVKNQQIISQTLGNFTGIIDDEDRFGRSVNTIGDIDGDGINEIAVSANSDDDGAENAGAFYILFLNRDGTVRKYQKISALQGGFSGTINEGDNFGYSVTGLGDIDGDGIIDIAVGVPNSDFGGIDRGAAWVLFLNVDGTVKKHTLLAGINYLLTDGDGIGVHLSTFAGYNSNGKKELIVGSMRDDDGATDAGAVYIIDLDVKHKPLAQAGSDQAVCTGSAITLDASASSVPDNDSLSYHWECVELDIVSQDSILNFDIPLVDQFTTYHFVLTVTCQGIASEKDTVMIYVHPNPKTPSIEQFADTLLATLANSYQWYYNGSEINGATDSTLLIEQSGNFQVKIINEIGCVSDISAPSVFIPTSINTIGYSFKVFPNPTKGVVNIVGLERGKDLTLFVYDQLGRLTEQVTTDTGNATIDLQHQKKGLYFIRFANQQESIKILKE